MASLSDDEFDTIYKAAAKRVSVSCDTEHAHSALQGCASPKEGVGDAKDVIICKLCEELQRVRRLARQSLLDIAGRT
jgi:hypothetical protein